MVSRRKETDHLMVASKIDCELDRLRGIELPREVSMKRRRRNFNIAQLGQRLIAQLDGHSQLKFVINGLQGFRMRVAQLYSTHQVSLHHKKLAEKLN